MDRRLGRHDPQAPSTLRIIQNAGFGEFPFLVSVDRPTLIVTRSVTQRFVICIDIPGQWIERRKIHRRTLDIDQFSRTDAVGIVTQILMGVQFELLIHRTRTILPLQIEIGVVGQVDDRRSRSFCIIGNLQFTVIRPVVNHLGL